MSSPPSVPDGGVADAGEARARAHLDRLGLSYTPVRHGRVSSVQEAAAARGVEVRDVLKTLVVRRGEDDYVLVLVPGDRSIAWPRLRHALGVSRAAMPDPEEARDVTGYVRGAITPLGSLRPWPVLADASVVGRTVSIGMGAHGASALVAADDLLAALDAAVADVTSPPTQGTPTQ
jgi:Cys-tRNA(Pro)/Cys-tRNA(Cys) deacylase